MVRSTAILMSIILMSICIGTCDCLLFPSVKFLFLFLGESDK